MLTITEMMEQRENLQEIIRKTQPALKLCKDGTCIYCGKPSKIEHGLELCDCPQAMNRRQVWWSERKKVKELYMNIEILDNLIENQEKINKAIIAESGIGKKFESRTFWNFDRSKNQTAYDTCEEYANGKGRNLILFGGVGVGKTHLAAAVVNKIYHDTNEAYLFSTAGLMCERLRDFDLEKKWVKLYKKAPILVIDDLGKQKSSDWNKERIFEVINARYENMLKTIVTTNLTLDELQKDIGAATFSRLCEDGIAVSMNGKDNRLEVN